MGPTNSLIISLVLRLLRMLLCSIPSSRSQFQTISIDSSYDIVQSLKGCRLISALSSLLFFSRRYAACVYTRGESSNSISAANAPNRIGRLLYCVSFLYIYFSVYLYSFLFLSFIIFLFFLSSVGPCDSLRTETDMMDDFVADLSRDL